MLRASGIGAAVVGLTACTMVSGADDLAVCQGKGCGPSSADPVEEQDTTLPKAPGKTPKKRGGPAEEAGPDASSSGGSSDAGGSGVQVACGDTTCGGEKPVCCVSDQKTCLAANDACLGVRVVCGGAAECGAGEICCLDPSAQKAACAPVAACVGQSKVIFCRADADCPPSATCRVTGGSFSEHRACQP